MALQSMTGFARASGEGDGVNWTWEVRSVNGKGLDVRLRIPSGFDSLDVAARGIISKVLTRGNVSATLSFTTAEKKTGFRVNQEVLAQYVAALKDVENALPDSMSPRPEGLLSLRGVIEQEEEEENPAQAERLAKLMQQDLTEAVEGLKENRLAEGARIHSFLEAQLDSIDALRLKAAAHAETQPEALRSKLKTQVEDILGQVPALPEERLAQEVAVLLVKADVREELDRLEAHVAGARDLLARGSPVGRKLDFLCQEFNREANTLCSKVQDVDLTRVGLDLKTAIDQFREQVQNIE